MRRCVEPTHRVDPVGDVLLNHAFPKLRSNTPRPSSPRPQPPLLVQVNQLASSPPPRRARPAPSRHTHHVFSSPSAPQPPRAAHPGPRRASPARLHRAPAHRCPPPCTRATATTPSPQSARCIAPGRPPLRPQLLPRSPRSVAGIRSRRRHEPFGGRRVRAEFRRNHLGEPFAPGAAPASSLRPSPPRCCSTPVPRAATPRPHAPPSVPPAAVCQRPRLIEVLESNASNPATLPAAVHPQASRRTVIEASEETQAMPDGSIARFRRVDLRQQIRTRSNSSRYLVSRSAASRPAPAPSRTILNHRFAQRSGASPPGDQPPVRPRRRTQVLRRA
jgi:hypothetical protein